jgi:hypothetical protein
MFFQKFFNAAVIAVAASLLGSASPSSAQGSLAQSAITSATEGVLDSITARSEQAKHPVAHLSDGNANTYWVSGGVKAGEGPTVANPQWVQFSFAAPTTVSQAVIVGRQNYGPREGEIQTSGNGKTFKAVRTFTSSGSRDMTVMFPPVKAKFFRVSVQRSFDPTYPDSARNVQISELRLIGVGADGKAASWPPSDAPAPNPDEWKAAGVVDPSALNIDGPYGQNINGKSFQQDAITSFKGWQYCVYYDSARRVCLARRKLPKGGWQIIRFGDYTIQGNDSHNTISMGICPNDGTIHLAFDHHATALHYRVSQPKVATEPDKVKWAANLFGPITSKLEFTTKQVSYPMFLQTPRGDLQFFYRYGGSGSGQWWMVDYIATSASSAGDWRRTRQIDSGNGVFRSPAGDSPTRNSYPNGFQYGPDGRLHYTWTWRESTQGANHDICYMYSEDGGLSWLNNEGTVVTSRDGKQIAGINSPGLVVVQLDSTWSLMNQQAQAVDSQGHVHVAMWHRRSNAAYTGQRWTPGDSAYYHYWRNDDGSWSKAEIPSEVGDRPKLLFDSSDNAYLIYTVNRNPRIWTGGGIYYVDGQVCVASASAQSKWTDWKVIYRHQKGSFASELQADVPRFKQDGTLSILAQHAPRISFEPTPIRVIDLKLGR